MADAAKKAKETPVQRLEHAFAKLKDTRDRAVLHEVANNRYVLGKDFSRYHHLHALAVEAAKISQLSTNPAVQEYLKLTNQSEALTPNYNPNEIRSILDSGAEALYQRSGLRKTALDGHLVLAEDLAKYNELLIECAKMLQKMIDFLGAEPEALLRGHKNHNNDNIIMEPKSVLKPPKETSPLVQKMEPPKVASETPTKPAQANNDAILNTGVELSRIGGESQGSLENISSLNQPKPLETKKSISPEANAKEENPNKIISIAPVNLDDKKLVALKGLKVFYESIGKSESFLKIMKMIFNLYYQFHSRTPEEKLTALANIDTAIRVADADLTSLEKTQILGKLRRLAVQIEKEMKSQSSSLNAGLSRTRKPSNGASYMPDEMVEEQNMRMAA